MRSTVSTHPLELVHINYLCLEPGKGKEENILIVMDNSTQYAQAFITWSQKAQTMDKILWDNFIIHYGLPEKILSNQLYPNQHAGDIASGVQVQLERQFQNVGTCLQFHPQLCYGSQPLLPDVQ